ncbi:MAG: tRNA (guanosine(46)-N7)-methyltransferase TrmB [Aquificae bacterium]|nr:tRNA (guanosine(46)-N7)-methyltransferase TrmB [Aquificota bacterium]
MYHYYINYRNASEPLNLPNLEVEIGFGKGDFLVKLAREYPDKNFLGFEIAEISIKNLLKKAKRENLKNLKCANIDAFWGFQLLLKDNSISHIYINYPDPFPKKRDIKRRITRQESLYIFAKKLKKGSFIELRTDHYPFMKYTIEQAKKLQCFDIRYSKINPDKPITRYEEKWSKMEKTLYKVTMEKKKEPISMKIRTIEKLKHPFPLNLENIEINPYRIENKKFKIKDNLNITFHKVWEKEGSFLIEAVLSEGGFVQKFSIIIKKKEDYYIFDVSPFSEVLKTKGIQESITFLAQKIIKS